jgi:DNA adenine methylase
MSKPVLKWVGGKSQILDEVLSRFPKEINNYHEIFLGGGSVLLGLLSSIEEDKIKLSGDIYVYDINKTLISLYNNIKRYPNELYQTVQAILNDYKTCPVENGNKKPANYEEAKTSKESYYYWLRGEFNRMDKDTLHASGAFIFLNKTCFRGLYRVGPNGFNVPFGNYKNPEVINLEHLNEVSRLIQKVNFINLDFEISILNAGEGDFVYLDPPYAPESKTSFVKYSEDGFGEDKHKTLFKMIKELPCSFLMSNSDVKMVREAFTDGYIIDRVLCKRSINAKNPESKTMEVLVSKI